jgi:hypothetical protein
MKIKSAINKLTKHGYKIATANQPGFIATSGLKQISLKSAPDSFQPEEDFVYQIRYHDGNGWWKKAPNITFALRKLGDAAKTPASVKPAGSSGVTREMLVKRYANSGVLLTPEQTTSLKIFCYNDVSDIFEKLFSDVYKSSRRYSSVKESKQRALNKKKIDLWNLCIENFLLDKSAVPLMRVEVSATVPGYENVFGRHGSRASSNVRVFSPVFARTSDEAKMIVKSLMGDLAVVGSAELIAIGDKEQAMNSYVENFGNRSSRKEEERSLAYAQSSLKEIEQSLENAKNNVELSKKKLELVSFLENFSSLATMSSQGDEISQIAL